MKALLALLTLGSLIAPASGGPEYLAEVEAWHEGRIERLRQPGSWLSLIGLISLPQGRTSLGCGPDADFQLDCAGPPVIGEIVVEGKQARFVATAEVTHDAEPVDEIELVPDVSGDPTVLECGTVSFYLLHRHNRPYLRVKDSAAPLYTDFHGIARWPVSADWRIVGEWVEYDEPRRHHFPDVLGQATEVAVEGEVRFRIDGTEYSLYPNDVSGDSMFWVFGDATNGIGSYGGGRFLYSDPPDEDGRVVLDFNLAYNPPCVFTPYATCPLPAEGNVLDLEVRAGEKMWGEAH